MAKEIFMPKLSSTMQVGTLLQWFKKEGETVEVGEPLFEIMTDKINIEVEAYEAGTLLKCYFDEDAEVEVNHVVGFIGNPDEVVPDSPPGVSGSTDTSNDDSEKEEVVAEDVIDNVTQPTLENGEKQRATPAARKSAKVNEIELAAVPGSGLNGRIHVADVEAFIKSEVAPKATPLAKKVAHSVGVDLATISGTGANGKIYRSDVDQVGIQKQTEVPAQRKIKLEGLRKIVGKRMLESVTTVPHVTLTTEVDMSKVIEIRKQILGKIEKQTGYRLSYTEIIIKAVAKTLKNHPNVNASLQGDEIILNDKINIGLAVAIDNGLVVPVVNEAEQKGLAALTEECKTLGKAAREGKLKPDQMTGGTFTISNLGMYAIDAFTPIINKPETAILGVGRINEKPVGINGSIELRPMMSLSLSFDHRTIDGAPAAAFLTDLKTALEMPFELLI